VENNFIESSESSSLETEIKIIINTNKSVSMFDNQLGENIGFETSLDPEFLGLFAR